MISMERVGVTATVTITDPNGINTQTVSDSVSVADAALTPVLGGSISVTQNVAANGITVAQFSDGNTSETPAAFTASINWGDGTTTASVVSGAGGSYSVSGSHTYANAGSYTATVTVADVGGSQVVIATPVTVAASPQYTVAQFSDPNMSDTASQFSASIAWGDGTTSSGTVVVGSGSFTVMASHAYGEESETPYQVTTTISGNGDTLTVQSTAQVGDPALSASQAPPAPPQAPNRQLAMPTIELSFGNANLNKIASAQPGLRIHIDDSFNTYVVNLLNRTELLAANQTSVIKPGLDTNLIKGTITIGPANSHGLLSWTIPSSIRVWWQSTQGGPWVQIPSGGYTDKQYKATGKSIPILLQGITPEGGTAANVQVEYTPANGGPILTEKLRFFYNVYTGLKLTGAAAPVQQFIQQLENASSYGLTSDQNGNVWRSTFPALVFFPVSGKYIQDFANLFNEILNNASYLDFKTELSTTTINVLPNPTNTPWIPDSWLTNSFYPDNIAAVSNSPKVGQADGPKVAAALIIHGLEEQYMKQIFNLKFQEKEGVSPDSAAGGALGKGVLAEENVLGWGTRVSVLMFNGVPLKPGQAPPAGQESDGMQFQYKKGNNVTTLIIIYDPKTLAFKSAEVVLPGG